jgi:hypothetical protein
MVGTSAEIDSYQAQLPLQADKLHFRWSGDPAPIVTELKGLLGNP